MHRAARTLAAARKQAEDERDSYRALFELAPDAYLVTDPAGTILEANRAADTMLGVPHRSLVGKAIASFVSKARRDLFRQRLLKLSSSEGVLEREDRLEVGKRILDVSMSIAPIRRRDELQGFRWIVRDITARKQTERELRALNVELEQRVVERTGQLEQERARLHAIVEQMPAGLLITNAAGEPVFVNGQAEQLLASIRATDDPDYSHRFPAFRLNGEPYTDGERPASRALLRGETTTAERLYFERHDGTRVLFEVSAAPIRDGQGRIAAAALTLQDLSGLERREHGEREFVANAAHQLRTPIAAVLSAIEVLQAGAKEIPEDRDLFLGHIEREADRLARLAHSLLLLARAQSSGDPIDIDSVELGHLLVEVADGLGTKDGVEIDVDCGEDLRIWSNRDLLEQAVTSLANNAVANTEHGRVTLGARADGSTIALEVRDTGRGIPEALQEQIFERFYRPYGATREGFGLGLAIVRQVAEALSAQVELESEVGLGTTVRLRLPGKLRA